MPEHQVQGGRTTTAPTPDRHTRRVHVCTFEELLRSHGLIADIDDPDLPVDRFPPGTALGGRRAAVVQRNINITILRHVSFIDPVTARSETIGHGLRGGLGIDMENDRIFFGWIKSSRLYHPTIQLHAIGRLHPEELQRIGCGSQFCDRIRDRSLPATQGSVVRQTDPFAHPRNAMVGEAMDRYPPTGRNIIFMGPRLTFGGQSLRGPSTIDPDPVEISARGIIRRSRKINISAALVHPVEVDQVVVPARDQAWGRSVHRHPPKMPPAVRFTGPDKGAATLEPIPAAIGVSFIPVGQDINPGTVTLREYKLHASDCGITGKEFALLLFPVQLLDNDPTAIGYPFHTREIVLTGIPGDLHPCHRSAGHRHDPDAHGRWRFPNLGIFHRDHAGINGIGIVHHQEIARAGGIHLPESDPLTIRTPPETIPTGKLLFIDPVESAVDQPAMPVFRQRLRHTTGQVLYVEIIIAHISGASAVRG